jgi:2'-5' RNA ligase
VTDYSGLIVPMPDLEPVVGQWRARYDASFADTPAHVTALFPWIPPAELTEVDLDVVGQLAKDWQPFEVCFAEFGTFDDADVHYLAPEPADPFLALTEDLCTIWPEYPPYEGVFAEVVPHLTVADGAGAR